MAQSLAADPPPAPVIAQRRWLRILPVALVMYTISYIDRTNVSLALDPRISAMTKDLLLDNRMKGEAAGIFFLGYVLLQMAGGYWAQRWSARKLITLCLVLWGICAVSCGLARTFRQFEVARFLLGMAESSVFPAATVLVSCWFPAPERVRANAYWLLCQPIAVVISAPLTGWCLGAYGWRTMLVAEGLLPLVWAPIWWRLIDDHPREAAWISPGERASIETALARETEALEPVGSGGVASGLWRPVTLLMIVICFLYNSMAYGCLMFFTSALKGRDFSALQYGFLFAVPYVLSVFAMIANSWHSDRTQERRGHVAAVLALSGASLILSVTLQGHFWASYAFLCCAIPGPLAALAPFFSIPSETLPRKVFAPLVGLVNGIGNLGGFVGPFFIGWLKDLYHSVAIPFDVLGAGMLAAAALAMLLPKTKRAPAGGTGIAAVAIPT